MNTDPEARGRGEWALIPAFGERRMGIGFGLFEPNPERFRPQMARVAQAFRTGDADVAYTILREERISLVFVGQPERDRYGEGIRKFGARHGSIPGRVLSRVGRDLPARALTGVASPRMTYLLFWAAAAAPGVPLGLRLFGRQPLGWIAGLAIGYTASCIAFWGVLAGGAASGSVFAARLGRGMRGALAGSALLAMASPPQPRGPVVTRRSSPRSCLIAPLLMAAPYRNLGAPMRRARAITAPTSRPTSSGTSR